MFFCVAFLSLARATHQHEGCTCDTPFVPGQSGFTCTSGGEIETHTCEDSQFCAPDTHSFSGVQCGGACSTNHDFTCSITNFWFPMTFTCNTPTWNPNMCSMGAQPFGPCESDPMGPDGCAQCTPDCLSEAQFAQALDTCGESSSPVIQENPDDHMFAYIILNQEMLSKDHLVVDNCQSDIDANMCASLTFINTCDGVTNLVDDNGNLEWQSAHNVELEELEDMDQCRFYEAMDLFTEFDKSILEPGDIIYMVSKRISGQANQQTWRLSCADAAEVVEEEEEEEFSCENVAVEEDCKSHGECHWTSNMCISRHLSCTKDPITVPFNPATGDFDICEDKSGAFGPGVVKFPCRWFFVDLGRDECLDEDGVIFLKDSSVLDVSIRISEFYDREVFGTSHRWDTEKVNIQNYPEEDYQPPIDPEAWNAELSAVESILWKQLNPALELDGPSGFNEQGTPVHNPMDDARQDGWVKFIAYIDPSDGNPRDGVVPLTCLGTSDHAGECGLHNPPEGGQITIHYQCKESMKDACGSNPQAETPTTVLTDEMTIQAMQDLRNDFNSFFNENTEWLFVLPSIVRAFFHDAVMVDDSDMSSHGCLKWVIAGDDPACKMAHRNVEAVFDVLEELKPRFDRILTEDHNNGVPLALSDPDMLVLSAALVVDRLSPFIQDCEEFDEIRHFLSSQVGFGRPNRRQDECISEAVSGVMCGRTPEIKSEKQEEIRSWNARLPPNHEEIIQKMMRDGMTEKDVVAMMGAHTIGFHRNFGWEASETCTPHSGPWTTSPDVFNNEYFHRLLDLKNKFDEELEEQQASPGAGDLVMQDDACTIFSPNETQWIDVDNWCQLCGANAPSPDSVTGCPSEFCGPEGSACIAGGDPSAEVCKESFDSHLLMLDTDIAMILTGHEGTEDFTPNPFLEFVEEFATHQLAFIDAFHDAFIKWADLGQENIHFIIPPRDRGLSDGCGTTNAPTVAPSLSPTMAPTNPTDAPTVAPSTDTPTLAPTHPTHAPSCSPSTSEPTSSPSTSPSVGPSVSPTLSPTNPTVSPSNSPSLSPVFGPTTSPSTSPSVGPSVSPTLAPTNPTEAPTLAPTHPTRTPSTSPTTTPSFEPTTNPSAIPTITIIGSENVIDMASTKDICYRSSGSSGSKVRATSSTVRSNGYCFHHVDSTSTSRGSKCRFLSGTPLLSGSQSQGSSRGISFETCASRCDANSECRAFMFNSAWSHGMCALYSDYPDSGQPNSCYSCSRTYSCWIKQASTCRSGDCAGQMTTPGVLFRGRGRCAVGSSVLPVDMQGTDLVGSDALEDVEVCAHACRTYTTGTSQCFAISFARRARCDLHLQPAEHGRTSTYREGTASWVSHNFCYEVYHCDSPDCTIVANSIV